MDELLWLEEVTGDEALAWVRARNDETVAALTKDDEFAQLQREIREVWDADDRIPFVTRRGDYLYNFWQDADHPRGLWRRTTLESYRQPRPDWEVVLDLDELAAAEGENWVWHGPTVLRPDYDRCLIELSRGGADATVVREFDLRTLTFVPDGFELGEAKHRLSWIDRDHIYVGTDFGPGSLTTSGYPRQVRQWRRGTPLSEAELVFAGNEDDMQVAGYHDPTKGFERDWISRSIDFFNSEKLLRTGDMLQRIDVPNDSEIDVHREWMLVQPRGEWLGHPAGSLLAIRFDEFLDGNRDFTVVFRPDEHSSLQYHQWTRDYLLLVTLTDVKSRLLVVEPGSWQQHDLPGIPDIGSADLVDTSPDDSNEYFLQTSGFTQPSTLSRGVVGDEKPQILKRSPAWFDTDGLTVEQHFATSDDGTEVPYFVIGGPSPGPTLLYAYGGFEISLTPSYSGTVGRAWLARGGRYVVANIRGGGEYGPRWHQAALKHHRHRAYQDLAAVARDLVDRGLCTPQQLGMEGGSNGGLLAGVMLTRYPELFGAIVSHVPLCDMLRYHKLLAGASWMAEYGDPEDPDDAAYLRSYSPLHNLHQDRHYPPTLIVTSTRDDRVHPAHARKLAARMRELGHQVHYYENIEGGHGAAADNAQRAFHWALTFTFLWRHLR
ncbi:prolyl oligopeptidase family serine peptidase [Thermocrispum municipale]|uniref:prolyl oligopeptidase family serine peptidase n=1 Tax=Thermocrispum municipale TaxID=37926 RepID=UPI0003F61E68|nr:prolyl oligopeptidase family serine peptidase [Thermocrispum municipale]